MSNLLETLNRVSRLEALGMRIRSDELAKEARELKAFYERGGNRAMRRAAARARRRKGGSRR